MVGKLKVLMWKHFVVRRRRFIHTPIELISTIIFFILLFIFKDNLTKVSSYNDGTGNIMYTESVDLETIHPPQIVYYAPDTETTRVLMERVGMKLKLVKNSPRGKGYYPANNDTYMKVTADKKKAFVIFQDMETSLPDKLNYTIRMNLGFASVEDTPHFALSGHHPAYGTVYEPFVRLQWAIDSSFLELKTDEPIEQKVYLQGFPYATSAEYTQIELITLLLYNLCLISLALVFVFLASRLLAERVSGIQELMRMVGVSGWLLHLSHFLNVAPAGLLYSVVNTVLLVVTANPILHHSNPFLLWLMLALHYVSVVTLAFATSYMLKKAQYAVTFASVGYMLYTLASGSATKHAPRWAWPACGLLPHVPLQWFWMNVAAFEKYGKGVSFGNIAQSHADAVSVLGCYAFSVVQTGLFAFVAWYLKHVNPGPYGHAYPFSFLCQSEFWSKKKVTPDEEMEELDGVDTTDSSYFEPPPQNAEVGIKVVNVSKVFPKNKALSNVSLKVYKGEITVLLGHNGAGKTTLMSIITGLISATEGQVFVEGLDTTSQREQMRQHLGLCPQHNLFFSDLNVLEHVMFFTLLKGCTVSEAKSSSIKLLEQLGLGSKLGNTGAQLSGGMRRRLQLACALAGDARVLVLDEPTSGLDVETRRELWDLLLSLRGSRAVLLSTHFMEEADALGDRVAALHAGRLRCFATPMHLKRAIGTGYRLTCTTVGPPREGPLSALVTSHVHGATLAERGPHSLTYALPAAASEHFPRLFNELETRRSELGVDSIGVGVSTLEEVFLKLCSDVTTTFSEDDVDGTLAEPAPTSSGMRLYLSQFCALFKRQFKHLLSNKVHFLVLQVFLPVLMIVSITFITNESRLATRGEGPVAMDLDLYKGLERRALYTLNTTKHQLRTARNLYPDIPVKLTPNVNDEILAIGREDILEYNKYLIGIEITDTEAKMLFTTVVQHAAPVAANVLSNLLAAEVLGAGPAVATYNQPLYDGPAPVVKGSKGLINLYSWTVVIALIVLMSVSNAVSLPCSEREEGARHLHVLAGAPPALPWAATLAAHALTYTLVLTLPVLIAAAAIDTDHTIDQPDFLGTLFVALVVGTCAYLAVVYLVSFYCSERQAGIVLCLIFIVFGLITPMLVVVNEEGTVTRRLLWLVELVAPPHALTTALVAAATAAAANAQCRDLPGDRPLSNDEWSPSPIHINTFTWDSLGNACVVSHCFLQQRRLNKVTCLVVDGYKELCPGKCYACLEKDSPARSIMVLLIQFVVYTTLVVLTEHGVFMRLFERLCNARYSETEAPDADDMVRAEKAYVRKAIELPKEKITDALLAHNLHKNYPKVFGKSCNAVRGVSFSVKKGECFGLLGVNGAGKSTIFKMLTGLETPTRGALFANGHLLDRAREQYLRSLGYCPQFGGLDKFLTGAETLALLLTLRGLSAPDAAREANTWIQAVGLQKYGGRAVGGYSGGCARRLAAAAALCGGAALLDEPSAGVDVAARRSLWAAVRRTAASRAVVISSHSMDETEALCGRIAIVGAGRVRALGSAGALRAAHAAGHAVVLRVNSPEAAADVTDSAKSDVMRLKTKLFETFNCTLKDEHKTMLRYHINDTMRYSELFAKLEQLRQDFSHLIQDYSVTETTLEEVFLSFAREENTFEGPTPV